MIKEMIKNETFKFNCQNEQGVFQSKYPTIWNEFPDNKYCKLGDGIPEDWLETNGTKSNFYTRRKYI